MKRASVVLGFAALVALLACGSKPPKPKAPVGPAVALPPVAQLPEEKHLSDLKQVTLAGENAEAYWAWSGRELILQSRTGDSDCDRIVRMPLTSVVGLP